MPLLFGSVTVQAQCAGPYEFFESVPTGFGSNASTPMVTDGWAMSVSNLSSAASPNNHSGLRALLVNGGTARFIRTPQLSAPGVYSFWLKATSGGYNFRVEHSTDPGMASPILLGDYTGPANTPWTKFSFDLVAASVPAGSYIRISTFGVGTMFFDDFAHVSANPALNTVIVP